MDNRSFTPNYPLSIIHYLFSIVHSPLSYSVHGLDQLFILLDAMTGHEVKDDIDNGQNSTPMKRERAYSGEDGESSIACHHGPKHTQNDAEYRLVHLSLPVLEIENRQTTALSIRAPRPIHPMIPALSKGSVVNSVTATAPVSAFGSRVPKGRQRVRMVRINAQSRKRDCLRCIIAYRLSSSLFSA